MIFLKSRGVCDSDSGPRAMVPNQGRRGLSTHAAKLCTIYLGDI